MVSVSIDVREEMSMKHTEGIFTYTEEHEIRVCATSKFAGTLLEVLLDGKSIFAESNCKKYHLIRVPVEDHTVTVFTKVAANGTPTMQLFENDCNMVDGSPLAALLEQEQAVCKKESRLQLLRNLVMQFFLFGIVAFFVAAIKGKFQNLGTAALLGLLAGAGLSLLFMLFDLFEGKSALKALVTAFASPMEIEDVEEEVEDVDPDEIEVPDDAENCFEVQEEMKEAAEEAEDGEEK